MPRKNPAPSKLGKEHGLTPREERFLLEWVKDFNGQRASLAASSKQNDSSAKVWASKTLTKPNVQAALNSLFNPALDAANLQLADLTRLLLKEGTREGEGASHGARVSALSGLVKMKGGFVDDAPHPNAALSRDQLLDRIEGILSTSDRAVIERIGAHCAELLKRGTK